MPDDFRHDDFQGITFDFAISGNGHQSLDHRAKGEGQTERISGHDLSRFLSFLQNPWDMRKSGVQRR